MGRSLDPLDHDLSMRRLALMDYADGVGQLLVVSCSDLLHSGFSVESHSDGLIGLHELVEFFRQLLVLDSDYTDVVVQGVNLHLQVRIVIEEG